LLEQIDSIVRNNKNIGDALDIVDKKVLVDVLGFEPKVCADARHIWKKLQRRRLKRG
jgi:adenine-specific DNA-methyltransferase